MWLSFLSLYHIILAQNFVVNGKLQNCHGNVSYVSVPRRGQSFKTGNEDVTALKDALENLNTRKSTSRWILTGVLSQNNSEKSELKPNLSSKLFRERSSGSIRSRINVSKIHDNIVNVIRHS